MKNKLLLFAIFIAMATQVFAEHVTPEKAAKVAENFITQKINVTNQTNASKAIELNLIAGDRNSENQHFYMFNLNDNQGWVIVSDDDLFIPILGYSTEGNIRIDNIPINMKEWLDGYNQEIQFGLDNKVADDEHITTQWKELFDGTSLEFIDRSSSGVSPLITTQWDQYDRSGVGAFYNKFCPYDNDHHERAVTGCVATAMAQVMNYWQYPEVGTGSHSYKHWKYGTLSANFGNTYYDWSNMPDRLSSTSSSTEIDAVATLMYHCGVSVEMNYGTKHYGGSGVETVFGGSNTADYALRTYFGYKSILKGQYKSSFSNDEWIGKLKHDLNNRRPLIYIGSGSGGHCFVCDGYDNRNYFHFNWGWSGHYDGYFSLTALNPGTNNYTNQGAIFGIEPSYSSCTTIGTGTDNGYSPFSNNWRYSWNECIYPKSSFSSACTINSICYECASTKTLSNVKVKIYMGEKNTSTHSSNKDWTPSSNLQLVYSKTMTIGDGEGWQRFDLDTPFEYSHNGNLVVVVSTSSSYFEKGLYWKYTAVNNSCLRRDSDSNTSFANHPSNNTGTLDNERANIKLFVSNCDQDVVVIGNEKTPTHYTPFNNYYKNSWNECIYPKGSFETTGTINAISYDCSATNPYTCSSIKIYMGERVSNSHSSTTDWTGIDNLELVYSGTNVTIGSNKGWQKFTLDTPFEYSKTGNLVVVVAKTAPSYTSTLKWNSTASSNACLYRQNDSNTSYAEYPNGSSGVLYGYRANIKLDFVPGAVTPPTQDFIVIGNGTSRSNLTPFDNMYKYSWNECIYPASSFSSSCVINSVSYYCSNASAYNCDNLRIYLAETNSSQFSSDTDWGNYTNKRLVYSKQNIIIGQNTGWQQFTLDTPYEYSGTKNLVIIVTKAASSYSDNLLWECSNTYNSCLTIGNNYDQSLWKLGPFMEQGMLLSMRANVKLGVQTSRGDVYQDIEVIEISGDNEISETMNTENLNGVNIFPNPAHNVINIEMEDNNFEYVIYNELGQVVRQGNSCGKSEINVEDCQKGLYLIKIATEEKTSIHKIIIE